MKRPGIWVPLGVNVATGRTGTALLRRFGPEGVAVWACYLAACKRSATPGQLIYCGEAEGWDRLGLAMHRPKFSLKDFFDVTGRLHQTRRETVGQTLNVVCTHWPEWNEAVEREQARERQARSRRARDEQKTSRSRACGDHSVEQGADDESTSKPGESERDNDRDTSVTRARVESERELRERTTSSSVVRPPASRKALLPAELDLELKAAGWSARQRLAGAEKPELAAAWLAAGEADESVESVGAFAWAGFKTGEPPHGNGPRITGWRWTRGQGTGTWVLDDEGTDVPPKDWPSAEEAKRVEEARRQRAAVVEKEPEPLSPEQTLEQLQALNGRLANGAPADEDVPIDAAERTDDVPV
ncbi:MAG: hypothetical protein ACM33U_09185 [Solirubrobacterales bacterium]|nr:hypothetical protein [Solirubrobacterales bacterium]